MKLTKEQINEKLQFIDDYIRQNSNAATASKLDENANIESKNLSTLASELHKDLNIELNNTIIYNKLEELFDKKTADSFLDDLNKKLIYVHDNSSIITPYCASVSLYPFLLNGTKSLGGVSNAPKHLESFCGSYINLVFQLASQFLGAIATIEFPLYFYHFAKKDYGEKFWISNKRITESCLQQVVYSINQPAASRNYQSLFVNFSILDKYYFNGLFGDFYFPDGSQVDWEGFKEFQKFFLDWINKERTRELLTFPVITVTLLHDGETYKDQEMGDFFTSEMSKGNSFFVYLSDSVDSLSSCCRLSNQIETQDFSYSLGAGGIKTGSKKVITINANRLIQHYKDYGKDHKTAFCEIVPRIHKYLYAFNNILEDLNKNNMLPAYKANFISLKDQYLTIGINGIVEAAEFLKITPDYNKVYKKFLIECLQSIYKLNRDASKKYNVKFNTEFVPGESLGVKNAKWDKEWGYFSPRDCYNSYFYPVESDISPIDKIKLHGKEIIKYLDGGSALHLNLEQYPTASGYRKLFDLLIKHGCNYFTTNILVTCCNDCGYIDKFTRKKCSKCFGTNISYATRVIGY